MTEDVDSAKQRLRCLATRSHLRRTGPDVDESKARLRSTAASFDEAGFELTRHLQAEELSAWVKKDPWRAALSASMAGFFAGNLKESEVLILTLLLRVLDLSAKN